MEGFAAAVSNETSTGLLWNLTKTEWGYIAAMASIVIFGSFNLPLKNRWVARLDPDPMVFQIFMNIGIFTSSWLVLTYNEFNITPWGILSGALWVTSSVLSLVAIQNVGLSVAQGVWSGSTIITAFIWGVILGEHLGNIYLSILGLVFLSAGVAGISVAGSRLLVPETRKEELLNLNQDERDSFIPGNDNIPGRGDKATEQSNSKRKLIIGLICAAGLGITNGSVFVPSQALLASDDPANGIIYVLSMGIGILGVTPLFVVIYFVYFWKRPVFHFPILPAAGFTAGALWNTGNWFSYYAIQYLGYGTGFPLCQLALLVGGLWGIFLFKEIVGAKRIGLFFLSVAVLLGGATLIGVYGLQK